MHVIKNVWSLIEGDPKFMRRVNGGLAIFWILMIPVSLAMGWLQSVTYVSALSLWALVSGHWAAWQAARVEEEQQKEEARDTDGKLIKRIIKETNLRQSPSGHVMKTNKKITHTRKAKA